MDCSSSIDDDDEDRVSAWDNIASSSNSRAEEVIIGSYTHGTVEQWPAGHRDPSKILGSAERSKKVFCTYRFLRCFI